MIKSRKGSFRQKGKCENVSIGSVGQIYNGNTTYNVTNNNNSVGLNELLCALPDMVQSSKDNETLRLFLIAILQQLLTILTQMGRTAPAAPAQQSAPNNAVSESARKEIVAYACRVRSLLAEGWRNRFDKIWDDLLNKKVISDAIYRVGKQQGTNFNRNLVANILYYMSRHGAYGERYNAAAMAFRLENSKDSSIRAALKKNPPADIMKALDRYFEELEKEGQKT